MVSLLEDMENELKLRGYSPRIRKAYLHHIQRFVEHVGRSPHQLSAQEIEGYFLALAGGEGEDQEGKELSRAYRNQAVSAIKFLYREVLDLPERASELPYLRKKHTLPVVLSREEIQRLLNVVTNLKHRAILMVIYSAGLRVSEAARLKVADIDCDRGMIFVRGGKGRKDRYTLLSGAALNTLRAYWKKYRPEEWLFAGARPGRHITARTIQKVFERARDGAKIRKDATVHTLRHSFATHLLEEGTDVRYTR